MQLSSLTANTIPVFARSLARVAQVLIGPETDDGPWYFSLNNRRLWVLKRCREEGLLDGNRIRVRVRAPKSKSESDRYTLDNCAVEAKIMREGGKKESNEQVDDDDENQRDERRGANDGPAITDSTPNRDIRESLDGEESSRDRDEDDDDSDSSGDISLANRFSALF